MSLLLREVLNNNLARAHPEMLAANFEDEESNNPVKDLDDDFSLYVRLRSVHEKGELKLCTVLTCSFKDDSGKIDEVIAEQARKVGDLAKVIGSIAFRVLILDQLLYLVATRQTLESYRKQNLPIKKHIENMFLRHLVIPQSLSVSSPFWYGYKVEYSAGGRTVPICDKDGYPLVLYPDKQAWVRHTEHMLSCALAFINGAKGRISQKQEEIQSDSHE